MKINSTNSIKPIRNKLNNINTITYKANLISDRDYFEITKKAPIEMVYSTKIKNSLGKDVVLQVLQADITKLEVDAIVNAANNSLLGGGGVDGAIHRAAGIELLEECKLLGGCKTGDAKITAGYNLPARYVIHTVGPDCRIQKEGVDEALASCYRRSMEVAKENGIKTIAFPAISCGIYAFPLDRATKIALNTIKDFIKNTDNDIDKVVFCAFDYKTAYEYIKNLD